MMNTAIAPAMAAKMAQRMTDPMIAPMKLRPEACLSMAGAPLGCGRGGVGITYLTLPRWAAWALSWANHSLDMGFPEAGKLETGT